jgi:signal transduction histidine kinase/CheY-like chemotaxis protein
MPDSSPRPKPLLARAARLAEPAAIRLIGFALAYYLLLWFGYGLVQSKGAFFMFWPASGLFLAALLSVPRRAWPWVVGAALLAEGAASVVVHRLDLLKLAYALCETAEALVAAWVVTSRTSSDARLTSVRRLVDLGIGVVAGCGVGALLNTLALLAARPEVDILKAWSEWFVGGALGMLVFTPALLAWAAPPPGRRPARRAGWLAEAALVGVVLVTVALLGFGETGVRVERGYLILPVLGWAALRFGLHGMTSAGVFFALVAAWSSWRAALRGAPDPLAGTSLQVQLLLAVSVGAALLLAVLLEERVRAERRAEAAERLASVGALAAGMAHEINNPLTYLGANLDHARGALLPLAGTQAMDSVLDALADAAEGAVRIGRVVRDLKLVSRIEPGERTAVSLQDEIGSAVKLSSHEVRHRARLVLELGPVPLVEAPRFQLGQVFVNLLVNAAHAIPEGHADENQIKVTTREGPGGEAIAEVSDTGGGIPEAVRSRIFEPFFTTKPVGHGTGLGLSVCHGIIASLGGHLEVESQLGRGTTFRVVLPAAPPLPPAATPAPVMPPPGPRARVLVVDDDALVGQSIRRTLRDLDVEVMSDGRAALHRLVGGERFDLVLCDLMMPNVNGVELYESLEVAAPDLARRVVFITAGAFTERSQALLERTRRPVLAKPFGAEALRSAVHRLLREQAG